MEWIKLRSLRSTWWMLAAGPAAAIGIGTGIGGGNSSGTGHGAEDLTFDAAPATLVGLLVVSVLGVLAVTSEYGSGAIRATLAATPRRLVLLAAKAAVFATVALIMGETASFLSYISAAAALPHGTAAPALTEPAVLRALALTGVSYCLLGLLGVEVGTIVRHTGAAVAIMLAGVFLVAPLAGKSLDLNNYTPLHIVEDSLAVSGGSL